MSPLRGDEFTGRTVEEAIERGLRALGRKRTEVDIEILEQMGVEAEVVVGEGANADGVEVEGSDLGVLIGRGGENLVALQQIVSAITSKKVGHSVHVGVDIEGYRRRREEQLREMAERV